MGWQNAGGWQSQGWGEAAAASSSLPLDGVSSVFAAFSFRKLRTAYAGSAIKVRRVSDSVTQNIGFSGNDFDVTSYNSFIGASSGTIDTFYDQGANGNNLAMPTTTIQPSVTLSGLNSKPVSTYAGGQFMHGQTLVGAPVSALSALSVGRITNTFNGMWQVSPAGAVNTGYDLRKTSTTFEAHDPGFTSDSASTDGLFHQFSCFYKTGLTQIAVDGTNATAGNGSTFVTTLADIIIGSLDGSTFDLTGDIAEMIFIGSDLSGGGDATIRANQKSYWATP